jgi:spore germination cell wall hydrolase CwlJ-like protein
MAIRNWAVGAVVALLTALTPTRAHANPIYNFGTTNARITLDQAQDLSPDQQKDLICVSLNVYHEARGTSVNNQQGVAWVVKNRMAIKNQSACVVVYERNGARGRPQFSWTVYKHKNTLEQKSWDQAQQIAYAVLFDTTVKDVTRGSTHFHEKHVKPVWSSKSKSRVVLGSHVFVRVDSYLNKTTVN